MTLLYEILSRNVAGSNAVLESSLTEVALINTPKPEQPTSGSDPGQFRAIERQLNERLTELTSSLENEARRLEQGTYILKSAFVLIVFLLIPGIALQFTNQVGPITKAVILGTGILLFVVASLLALRLYWVGRRCDFIRSIAQKRAELVFEKSIIWRHRHE